MASCALKRVTVQSVPEKRVIIGKKRPILVHNFYRQWARFMRVLEHTLGEAIPFEENQRCSCAK